MERTDEAWITACHEAAHAIVNHALGVHTVRLRIAPDAPRDGLCEPEKVFEQYCGDNELAHPVTTSREHVWSVAVARRHAVAALAGIAMEDLLAGTTNHVPMAEDSADDRAIAEQDILYALKFVGLDSQPYVAKPDIPHAIASASDSAATILSWPSAHAGVKELAGVLLNEEDISDPQRIREIIEHSGLSFGEALPAFLTGLL